MRSSGNWLRRPVAGCLVLLLTAPFAHAAPVGSRQQTPSGQQTDQTSGQAPSGQSPNSDQQPQPSQQTDPQPPATPANATPATPDPGTQTAPQGQSPAPTTQQPAPPTQQEKPLPLPPRETTPVGTAAAPYEKAGGNAASRPAGAAIAPGKQKRKRMIVIKVALLVGAAAAIGTVVGLSAASPSRP